MYTFLMADDEEIIRKGFEQRLNWDEHGFEFLPSCENGDEVLASVEKYHPDVLLTDINMPGKDGLEVCSYVSEHYPDITLVILSGYDEFEYAQKAVQFKVFEYLLKPINAKKLRELLERLKMHLDREKSFRSNIAQLKKQAEQSRELIRERYLNRLISGRISPKEQAEYEIEVGSILSGTHFCVIVADPDDPENLYNSQSVNYSLYLLAVENHCRKAAGENAQVFQRPGRQIAAIFSGKTERFVIDETKRFIREFYHLAEDLPYSTVTLGIGAVHEGVAEIHLSCREAETAIDYRFIQGRNSAIRYAQENHAGGRPIPAIAEDSRNILQAIKTGSADALRAHVSEFFNHLRESRISVYRSELEIQKYFVIMLNALEELDISCSDLNISSESDPILALKMMKTLEESEIWLLDFCRLASEKLSRKRQDFSEKKVYEAVDYLMRNFSLPELSTEMLSEQLAISSGYLSRIFKKHTQMTILEYLMNLRVEKAKEIIASSNLKNYEISESVGYTDSGYFGTIFRKVTGMTLTEYRSSLGAQ